MQTEEFTDLFVSKDGKIEDVQFWMDPVLTIKALRNIGSQFDLQEIDGFVALEARGFYLAGVASSLYSLPTVIVRKHKPFYDKMSHEVIRFKNWKGESESLTVLKSTLPKVKSVLIVDDILDTGASLKASKELLSRLEIEIKGAFYLLNSYGDEASENFGLSVKSILTRKLFS